MNRLYFVRHGENPANLTKEMSSLHVDYSLTPKGILQAQQTAEWFEDKNIHAVYASPMKRAYETADIIAERLGLPVTILEGFREIQAGSLEEQPPCEETWAAHNAILAAWRQGDHDARFPGPTGDDYHALWGRMQEGLAHIMAAHEAENIIVAGHGGQFNLTFASLFSGDDAETPLHTVNHNCAISELLLNMVNDRPVAKLVFWAKSDHLHGEAAKLVRGIPALGELSDPE